MEIFQIKSTILKQQNELSQTQLQQAHLPTLKKVTLPPPFSQCWSSGETHRTQKSVFSRQSFQLDFIRLYKTFFYGPLWFCTDLCV